ncbi:MAG TPA: ParB/RepB/Spo0J family partition protein [Dehalococcoidales bacterium]|nr:ParB/RepB/Spo0J family partition protein [Dehalococcoidales bacterium]
MTVIREVKITRVLPNYCIICEESVILHLCDDIKKNGLREPIVVEMVEQCFRIIDGEKRWRACRRIGLDKIRVEIHEESSP